jgi:hypothetical protein
MNVNKENTLVKSIYSYLEKVINEKPSVKLDSSGNEYVYKWIPDYQISESLKFNETMTRTVMRAMARNGFLELQKNKRFLNCAIVTIDGLENSELEDYYVKIKPKTEIENL